MENQKSSSPGSHLVGDASSKDLAMSLLLRFRRDHRPDGLLEHGCKALLGEGAGGNGREDKYNKNVFPPLHSSNKL